MHTIQFNQFLKKRKRSEDRAEEWIDFATKHPEHFVKTIGFPRARVLEDGDGNITVKQGASVVAYYNRRYAREAMRVTSSGLFPLNLFARFGPPPTLHSSDPISHEDAWHVDVIPRILCHLGVQDACSLGMTVGHTLNCC